MNGKCTFIETSKQDVVEVDIPDAIACFFERNEFAVESLTEKDLS